MQDKKDEKQRLRRTVLEKLDLAIGGVGERTLTIRFSGRGDVGISYQEERDFARVEMKAMCPTHRQKAV